MLPIRLADAVGDSGQQSLESCGVAVEQLVVIEKGASVRVKSNYGTTLLAEAARKGDKGIVKALLKYKALINGSELIKFAKYNHIELAILVLENGSDVKVKGKNNHTALHWAANLNNLNLAKVLIEKGADINAQLEWGDSVLLRALDYGSNEKYELIKYLIGQGADVNLANGYGDTPIKIARKNNYSKVIKLLKTNGAK